MYGVRVYSKFYMTNNHPPVFRNIQFLNHMSTDMCVGVAEDLFGQSDRNISMSSLGYYGYAMTKVYKVN